MELTITFEFPKDGPCEYVTYNSAYAKGHHYSYEKLDDGLWHYAGSEFLSQFVNHELLTMDEVVAAIAEGEDEAEAWEDHGKFIPKPECILAG